MRISAVTSAILIAVFSTTILTTPASAQARKYRRRTRNQPNGLRVEPTSVPVTKPTAERYKKIDDKDKAKKYCPESSLQSCILVVLVASFIRAFSVKGQYTVAPLFRAFLVGGEDTEVRRSKIS